MPLVRYKPANRSISARPRRPTTAPDSPLINRVHHKSSAPNRCVPRTLTFEDLLKRAKIRDFWFHDLRHTFASWYMMNGGDLYELAKLLGHANIKMTERYAKLARKHIAKTGDTAKVIWSMLDKKVQQEDGDVANIA